MEFNREKVLQLYAGGKEELRAQRSRSNSIEFYYTEKILRECLPKNAHILELGCGTGYYGMLFADLCASYTGIDLSPDNIAEFRRKIDRAQKTNLRAEVGDATALTGIPDNDFDAVLCLGPMYQAYSSLPLQRKWRQTQSSTGFPSLPTGDWISPSPPVPLTACVTSSFRAT